MPKKEPKYINRKIDKVDKILVCKPIIKPIKKNIIIKRVFPKPIPKYDPTKPIYTEDIAIDIKVDNELSINLTLKR